MSSSCYEMEPSLNGAVMRNYWQPRDCTPSFTICNPKKKTNRKRSKPILYWVVLHTRSDSRELEDVMLDEKRSLMNAFVIVLLACALNSPAQDGKDNQKDPKPKLGSAPAVLWREPADIKTRDLFYGQGGPDHQPNGKLSFIKEKLNGVNPKFDVRDEAGIRWGVKMGNEAKPETAATRLIWAVGYFTNEDYYLPELNVNGDMPLTRGKEQINHGKISGVRLKRHSTDEHQIADWSWDNNPFVGTKELDGLKIMMELICNTDLKTVQQHVYDVGGVEQRYIAADVGASFGKAGKTIFRTKGKLHDYE